LCRVLDSEGCGILRRIGVMPLSTNRGGFEANVPVHLALKLRPTLIDEVLESPKFLTRAVAGKVPTSRNLCVRGGEVDIQRRVHIWS